ncbi:hypothetical protein [Embleya sp. AB8]|uniref:hypothetical protein n=1 Tax=Embleya sp. AB8 TaxID=3156304 RepID=UPI003C75BFF1
MTRPDFVVSASGVVVPVVAPRTVPPREEPRRVPERIGVGEWVASLPGRGHDFPPGRVERAEDCAGLDNDRVLIVIAGGVPHMVKASEVHKVKPPG